MSVIFPVPFFRPSTYLHAAGLRWCALLPLLWCAACAHQAKTAHETPDTTALATDNTFTQGKEIAPVEEALPNVELTAEIFYQINVAEIALQRGELGGAYATYLQLGQTTRDPRLARRATDIALYGGDRDSALIAARLWQQLAPNSVQAAQTLLGLLVSGGYLDEAEPLLAAQLQHAPTDALYQAQFLQLSRLLGAAPNKNEALALGERLLAPYAGNPYAQLGLAQLAATANQRTRALRACDAALRLKPEMEAAALLKAQLLFQDGLNTGTQGLAFLKNFLLANPSALEARSLYARALLNAKQPESARQQFERLLLEDPQNAQAIFALGALAADVKNFPLAESYFRRYLATAKKTRDSREIDQAVVYLAEIVQYQGRTDEALELLEQLSGGQFSVNTVIRRAQILGQAKRFDEARTLLQQSKAQNQIEQNQLTFAEVNLLRSVNQHQTAFEVLERAVAKQPEDPNLLYELGMAAEKINRTDIMEKSFRTVITLRPDDPHAYNALGYSLADRNQRLKEAQALIEKAFSLAPQDAFIIDSMGWVQYRLGHLDKAREYLERSRSLRPDPEVLVHLGEVLWMQGQHETAQTLWREARAKEPDNEALQSTLKRLKVNL